MTADNGGISGGTYVADANKYGDISSGYAVIECSLPLRHGPLHSRPL
jgi:hypothetical protein